MARNSRRGFTPRRTKRAVSAWGYLQSNVIAVGPLTKVLIGSFILSNPPLGETILRTRVNLWVGSDQSAAVENQQGAFGLIVVTDRAVAAGAASIPGPATDGGDDGWFVHQAFNKRGASTSFGVPATPLDVDSKAMRKVEDGGEIAIMVENIDALHNITVLVSVRLLAKLTES